MIKKTSISKDSEPCTQDQNYRFDKCIHNYIAELIGCQFAWFSSSIGSDFPPCSTREQLISFEEQMTRLSLATWKDLTRESGCLVKCTINQFIFTKHTEEVVTWKHSWSSAFYLTAEATMLRKEDEYLIFDKSDTINGIGGAMGLFLGWSVLFLLQKCVSSGKNICLQIYNYLNN